MKNKKNLLLGFLLAAALLFATSLEARAQWDWGDDSASANPDTLNYDEEWDASSCDFGEVPDANGDCVPAGKDQLGNGEEWDASSCDFGEVPDANGDCVPSGDGQLGNGEQWDCSAFPGTTPDANGNCVDNADTFAGCVAAGSSETECQSKYGNEGSFCDGGTCYNSSADYCRVNTDDPACGGKGVSCEIDSDCQNGLVCNVWGNTCGASAWGTTTDFFTGSRSQGGSLTSSLKTAAGLVIPKGSTVYPDGSVVTSDGKSYPAGTVESSTMDNGFDFISMFGNSGSSTGGYGTSGNGSTGGYGTSGSGYTNGGGYGTSGFVGPPTAAQYAAQAKCGNGFVNVGGVCFPDKSITGLSDAPLVDIIANLFIWLMGIFVTLAVIAFIISGIMYLTAYGDNAQMESAKKNAKWAIYGIIIGLSGFIIVNAVAKALAGSTTF